MEEIAGRMIEFESEEFLNLCAGDENGNTVGEADDHRAGKIFYGSAHAGYTEQNQEHACHHGADEKAVDAMLGDDAGYDDYECAGGPANLRFGAAERGDDESGNDGAVETVLRRDAGGDGEGHGEGESDE